MYEFQLTLRKWIYTKEVSARHVPIWYRVGSQWIRAASVPAANTSTGPTDWRHTRQVGEPNPLEKPTPELQSKNQFYK